MRGPARRAGRPERIEEAYSGLGMVQLDTSGETPLGERAQLRDGELIKLEMGSVWLAYPGLLGERELRAKICEGASERLRVKAKA